MNNYKALFLLATAFVVVNSNFSCSQSELSPALQEYLNKSKKQQPTDTTFTRIPLTFPERRRHPDDFFREELGRGVPIDFAENDSI
ncbi:hypothetical protein [Fodinibius salsisoli]|uniref:Uncharacterized protein n=1 Tax=Fodinibius salsisoli TaxID=2820877 RepID=A0ABT3PQF4_9BACT|nr:hypothetical protein [Fodinibius salsisoli]MCW9708094.1 hypothetical protein [Fodinibius salsisoli]